MVAFVAGATGYVGREVVRELIEQSQRAVAHVRPDSPRLAQWSERFSRLGAEVDATEWTTAAMTARLTDLSPSVVFALLGTTSRRARSSADADESYETVDYGLTASLLTAAVAAGTHPRFVYLSSAGVHEQSRGAYLRARAKTEQAVRASGLPYTIARPSFITGPDRDDTRPGERLGAAVADGLLRTASVLGAHSLRERYRSTTNTALAHALVRLALDPMAENQVIESEALR